MSRPSRDCDLRRSDRLAKSNGITKSSSAPTLLVAITRDIATAVPSRTAIAHSPCQFPLPNYATPDFLAPHSSTGADMYVASYSCEVIFAAIRPASVGGTAPEARLRCHHRLFREEKKTGSPGTAVGPGPARRAQSNLESQSRKVRCRHRISPKRVSCDCRHAMSFDESNPMQTATPSGNYDRSCLHAKGRALRRVQSMGLLLTRPRWRGVCEHVWDKPSGGVPTASLGKIHCGVGV